MNPQKKDRFIRQVFDFYKTGKRDLPWRATRDPYRIVVSEVMLQQTQVSRVLEKYPAFIKTFPNFSSLADASVGQVLGSWKGLGYNRRALYLKKISHTILTEHKGVIPKDEKILQTLPGIGAATASSILVFAFNTPLIFIETNIRRVFIHHFFNQENKVNDKDILPLIEQTMDRKNPREWYYALMDYGTYLAKQTVNPNRKSAHYVKQSKFEGSVRQLRGEILRILLERKKIKKNEFERFLEDGRFNKAIEQLQKEEFITVKDNIIFLS